MNHAYLDQQWALAHGPLTHAGVVRQHAQDFIVEETLSFQPGNEGQHVYLNIRKCNLNTQDVVNRLAKFCQCGSREIGYAGLKDKHAMTTQWFSVDLAGKSEPDWTQLSADDLEILQTTRHTRKLKRGAIASNRFVIRIRQLQPAETDRLIEKLNIIKQQGVPNYFGEQRFGRENANVKKALRWFAGESKAPRKQQRSMVISAARSWLFNKVLSARVEQGTWNTPLPGDVMGLRGSRSYFAPDAIESDIIERCANGDISPTGPLWGKEALASTGEVKQLEVQVADKCEILARGLEQVGLTQQRRDLRVLLEQFDWQALQDKLELTFSLPSGSYATAVLREIVNTGSPDQNLYTGILHQQ